MMTKSTNWQSLLTQAGCDSRLLANITPVHKPEFGYDNEQMMASLYKDS